MSRTDPQGAARAAPPPLGNLSDRLSERCWTQAGVGGHQVRPHSKTPLRQRGSQPESPGPRAPRPTTQLQETLGELLVAAAGLGGSALACEGAVHVPGEEQRPRPKAEERKTEQLGQGPRPAPRGGRPRSGQWLAPQRMREQGPPRDVDRGPCLVFVGSCRGKPIKMSKSSCGTACGVG